MHVDIRSLGFPTTVALTAHAKRRLRFVLTRHSDRIHRVVVRLGDENGPRGGSDKFCRVQVHLRDAPAAIVSDVGPDLYEVIDRASDRVGRAVVRHLDRARIGKRRTRVGSVLSSPEDVESRRDALHFEGERA